MSAGRGQVHPRKTAHGLNLRAWGAAHSESAGAYGRDDAICLERFGACGPGVGSEHADTEWFEKYSRRIEDYRLPKSKEARQEYLEGVGADGMRLLAQIDDPHTPESLKGLSEIEVLRRIWKQQYDVEIDGERRARAPKEMPEAAHCIESPYEPEARYATKRGINWVGYKVHLTKSCDDDSPNLITNERTTLATATDVKRLCAAQERLARSGLLPTKQSADAAYVCGSNLVSSYARQIDPIGPPYRDNTWRAKAGFDVANFQVDWEKKVVTRLQERQSIRWSETKTARGRSMIRLEFPLYECAACPSRPSCTRAKNLPRPPIPCSQKKSTRPSSLPENDKTEEFTSITSQRAGIEGTISQGVRAFGLRQARYQGLKRIHLQELATAEAVNVGRIADWLNDVPTAVTRRSRLVALAQAS